MKLLTGIMLSSLEKKVAVFIETNGLFAGAGNILLAVSGGADSIALMHVMMALKAHGVLKAKLYCAHINHRLRAGQADRDEEFVISQAAKFQLNVTARHIDVREYARVNKISIETAARKLRMKSLIEIAGQNKCTHVVTGHQKDDNAETVLHRMLRGTGFRGLAGIWPERTFDGNIMFVRPLLCVTRDEIIVYLRERKLQWCEDATNADCVYTRNYIRHKLLPAMQMDSNSSIVENLYDLSVAARKFHKIICSNVDEIWPRIADCIDEKVALNLELFSEQSQPVRIELIRRSLTSIGCGERNLTEKLYQKILQQAQENITGRKIHLPGGFLVVRYYKNMIFSTCRVGLAPPKTYRSSKNEPVILKIPGRTNFGQYLIEAEIIEANESCRVGLAPPETEIVETHKRRHDKYITGKTKNIECFDMDKIAPPLSVRLRQPGERFIPLGQKSEIKIGKFLTAQKVPHEIRRKGIVVTDNEKIIWLCPVRISEHAKIADGTNKILQLEISDTKEKE